MNVNTDEKSDKVIVPEKRPNKGDLSPAEVVEERTLPKGNTGQTPAVRTQGRAAASSGLASVRQTARRKKDVRFTALLHHITINLLEQSYFAIQRGSAPGIDGVTWRTYGECLQDRLSTLHERIHRGSYRARPARRRMIPKADGSERPLSILCLEDKIVQQAVVFVLEAIYEDAFLGFSYGFRPGRGPHDALDALWAGIYEKRINWVLDADIQRFFDAMSHDWILRFLQHRIGDKRLLRLVAKWLKVGVMKDHHVERSTRGSPQGAVISPILANIYLHYAFDLWAHSWRRQQAKGDVIVVRYADDTVLGFEHESEAHAFLQAMQDRLETFGLTLHPDKTRLIQFGRYAVRRRKQAGLSKPETFDFLGFTHFCTTAYGTGSFAIGRKTIKKHLRARLQLLKIELRRRFHEPIAVTGRWLYRVLRGHINYFSVTGNDRSIWAFFQQIRLYWLHALQRRSQKGTLSWEKFTRLTDRFFPTIHVVHPHPHRRFVVRTRGRSPVR